MRIALFDLDNTLYDRDATFRRWAEKFAQDRAFARDAVEWLILADQDGLADRTELWSRAKANFGLPEPVEALVSAYYAGYWEMLRPDRDVQNCLADLQAADWRICIVTNGRRTLISSRRPNGWEFFPSSTDSAHPESWVSPSPIAGFLKRHSCARSVKRRRWHVRRPDG